MFTVAGGENHQFRSEHQQEPVFAPKRHKFLPLTLLAKVSNIVKIDFKGADQYNSIMCTKSAHQSIREYSSNDLTVSE